MNVHHVKFQAGDVGVIGFLTALFTQPDAPSVRFPLFHADPCYYQQSIWSDKEGSNLPALLPRALPFSSEL